MGKFHYYSYVSTKTGCDCVPTVFLCAPGAYADSASGAEEFAELSGWKRQAEENAAVLIVPLALGGWGGEDPNLLRELFEEEKNSFTAPTGRSIPGRDGALWLWETMIYAVGYQEGASYLGNAVVANPNFFAASALVDGCPTDYSRAGHPSSHWFVPHPSEDYHTVNSQIPAALWFFGLSEGLGTAVDYFRASGCADAECSDTYGGIYAEVYQNVSEEAIQVRVSKKIGGTLPKIAAAVMDTFFASTIRWKNGPDGTLKRYSGRRDYWNNGKFIHHSVQAGHLSYHYSVYLPKGVSKARAAGLPLVLSMHGRGEPTWVFAEKNGWDVLADETWSFIVAIPDSEYNIWTIERDYSSIETIIRQVTEDYHIDTTRVYMTGFSNGAIFTAQQATTHPQLFAAASPWNGPGIEACRKMNISSFVYEEKFAASGYELPFWICVGDNDGKAAAERDDELALLLPANGCSADRREEWTGSNHYTKEKGYMDGDRFHTVVYLNSEGSARVGITVMKNMPHGAVWDESRAAWEFMKHFRRPAGSKMVEII